MAFPVSQSRKYGLLILIICAASLWPIFIGQFPAVGDMRDVYIPLEIFFQSEQLQGHIPAWNPDIAWGFPVIASAQIGFFNPVLLVFRLLPINLYLPLILILHLFLTALGTFKLFQAQKISDQGAFMGALAFALGGFLTLHLTHLNIFMAVAWLPWQLYLLHKLTTHSHKRLLYLTLSTFALGLPLLIGQIQIPLLMILFSLIWFIYQGRKRLTKKRTILLVAFCLFAAMLLGAAQLLPTYELASISSRGNSESFNIERANQYSYPLYHLPATLFPFFYSNDDTYWGKRLQVEQGFYFGTIPFLLLLTSALLWLKKRSPLNPDHKFWLIVLVTSFLLALGDLSPFRLIGLEPSLWYFSAPARWLLFTSMAASYFIASSYDSFIVNLKLSAPPFRRISIYLLAIIILLNFLLLSGLPDLLLDRLSPSLTLFQIEKLTSLLASAALSTISLTAWPTWLVVGILALIISSRFNTPRNVSRSLILITGIELAIIASVTTPYISWSTILNSPSTIGSLPSHVQNNQSRILTITDGGDTGAYFTDPETRANDAKRHLQLLALVPLVHSQHQISGVAWPASIPLSDASKVLASIQDDYAGQDNTSAAYHNVGLVLDTRNKSLAAQEIEPAPRYVFLSQASHQEIPIIPNLIQSQKIEFATSFDEAGELVIRDTWYPGWQASIDGLPISIDKHQRIFRKVIVPAGSHVVSLKYVPTMLYSGLIITLITAIVLILIIAYSYRPQP